MEGCIAPSEVPGVSSQEASVFGGIAEDILYVQFVAAYGVGDPFRLFNPLFKDDHNPAGYLYFLASNNPQFTERVQRDFYFRLMSEGLFRIPDFVVHTFTEKAFYEVKPDSKSGITDGVDKVGTLQAVYPFYKLPYVPGVTLQPADTVVASAGSAFRVTLRFRYAAPGLLVYKLCVDADKALELATLAALLRLTVREINKQRKAGKFRPVDLSPVFRNSPELGDLARVLGLVLVAGAAAVGWKYFWRAVAIRFAARGALAVALAAATGPIPVGELLDLGLAVWTVVDIIRLSDQLWRDAAVIAREEA